MVSCSCEFVIFYLKVQGDLGAAAAFCTSKKKTTLPSGPQILVFHISLPAVALLKCQVPDKHVMEVNLRGGKVFVRSNTVEDACFLCHLPFSSM